MRAGFAASLFIMVLSLVQPAFSATPAPASKPAPVAASPAPVAATPAPVATAPAGVISDTAIDKMAKMTVAQRDELIKQQAEKLQKMTPQERQAFFLQNREKYKALSPEQKAAIREKTKKISAEYMAAHKAEWARNMAECKKMQDKRAQEFAEKMPAVERAVLQKYKELRKTHSKDYAWHMIIEDAAKGVKLKPAPEEGK